MAMEKYDLKDLPPRPILDGEKIQYVALTILDDIRGLLKEISAKLDEPQEEKKTRK